MHRNIGVETIKAASRNSETLNVNSHMCHNSPHSITQPLRTVTVTKASFYPTVRGASALWGCFSLRLGELHDLSACRGSSQQKNLHTCLFHKHRGYGCQMEPLYQPRKTQSTGWITKNRQPTVEMSQYTHTQMQMWNTERLLRVSSGLFCMWTRKCSKSNC